MAEDLLSHNIDSLVLPQRPTTTKDDIAVRVRAWYEEATTHPLWTKFRQEADEDEGYYVGGIHAWSKDYSTADARALQAEGRPVVTIQHIAPMVDLLVGTEVNARMDIRAQPQGEEDDEDARQFSELMHWSADQCELNEYISEGYKLGIIRGMSLFELGIDWTENPIDGEIFCRVLKPGRDVIWDPHWVRYDLSDANYLIEYRWAWVDDVIAEYPDHEAAIRQSLGAVFVPMAAASGESTEGASRDAYGGTQPHPIETTPGDHRYYDPQLRRVLICQAWYREWDVDWQVVDRSTGRVEDFEQKGRAEAAVKSDPDRLTLKRRARRNIRTATVLPAAYVTLTDAETPYENDRTNYPHVAFIANRIGDEIKGLVRDLKDLLRIENKRWSQAIELASKYATMRPKAEELALVNPDALRDPADQSVLMVRPGKMNAVGWHHPTGLTESVKILEALALDAKAAMREVGPNVDLLGLRGDASSGIALARRQMQGQTQMAGYPSNLRRTRKLLAQRLGRRVQQSFSRERFVRLTNELGEDTTLLVNPVEFRSQTYDKETLRQRREEAREQQGKPRILRDIESLKYDIRMTESPATPTARAATVEQLIQVADKYPGIFPLIADVLFELIPDLPKRPLLLSRIRRWQAAQGLTEQPGGGPMPPPGARPELPRQPGAMPGEIGTTVMPMPPHVAPPMPPPGIVAAPGTMG